MTKPLNRIIPYGRQDVQDTAQSLYDAGFEISEQTLLPLDAKEREVFLALLKKLT